MIAPHKAAQLAQHKGVRQFVKFGIVGASSTVITFIVLNFALIVLHQNKYVAATLAFLVSVCNGYIWNKRWTFKGSPEKAFSKQFTQFLLVNLVGLTLNLLIIKAISIPLEREFHVSMIKATNLAQLAAICCVVFWNFFANRFWTFKH